MKLIIAIEEYTRQLIAATPELPAGVA